MTQNARVPVYGIPSKLALTLGSGKLGNVPTAPAPLPHISLKDDLSGDFRLSGDPGGDVAPLPPAGALMSLAFAVLAASPGFDWPLAKSLAVVEPEPVRSREASGESCSC